MVASSFKWALVAGGILALAMAWYGFDQASCVGQDCSGASTANAIGFGLTSFVIYTPVLFAIALGIRWVGRAFRH